jgi:hypothetical protein
VFDGRSNEAFIEEKILEEFTIWIIEFQIRKIKWIRNKFRTRKIKWLRITCLKSRRIINSIFPKNSQTSLSPFQRNSIFSLWAAKRKTWVWISKWPKSE